MKTSNLIRQIAKSHKWQVIYARSKEVSGINLFNNISNFTPLQVAFLQWLEIYHVLERDLAMKEPGISKEVIEDDIRVDAYLHWRNLKDKEPEKPELNNEYLSGIPSVVFRRGK